MGNFLWSRWAIGLSCYGSGGGGCLCPELGMVVSMFCFSLLPPSVPTFIPVFYDSMKSSGYYLESPQGSATQSLYLSTHYYYIILLKICGDRERESVSLTVRISLYLTYPSERTKDSLSCQSERLACVKIPAERDRHMETKSERCHQCLNYYNYYHSVWRR